jgi:CelD/BcsL family acetyltransferase involved in cellulose biosynthesis
MRIEQLQSSAWDDRGRDRWHQVVRCMPTSSPFLSTAWTNAWMGVFGRVLNPVQVSVLDPSGAPIGSCLLTSRVRRDTVVPHVRVHLNTDGENAMDSVIVEHNALLAIAGAEDVVAQTLAGYVISMRADEFRVAGAGEAEVDRLVRAFPGWTAEVEWHNAPFVNLDLLRAAARSHLDVLSRNTREQLRRSLTRYQRRGRIVVEVARTVREAEAMFGELVGLHESRWQAVGHSGAFASASRREFHRAFIREGVLTGNAHLLRITVGGDTIAVLYNLVANGRVNFYQSGLRHEDDKHLKPGMAAHHLAIQHYLEHGYAEYDFLSSAPGEGRYKSSLANDSRQLAHLTLARPGWRRSYFDGLRRLRRGAKSVRRTLAFRRAEPVAVSVPEPVS